MIIFVLVFFYLSNANSERENSKFDNIEEHVETSQNEQLDSEDKARERVQYSGDNWEFYLQSLFKQVDRSPNKFGDLYFEASDYDMTLNVFKDTTAVMKHEPSPTIDCIFDTSKSKYISSSFEGDSRCNNILYETVEGTDYAKISAQNENIIVSIVSAERDDVFYVFRDITELSHSDGYDFEDWVKLHELAVLNEAEIFIQSKPIFD